MAFDDLREFVAHLEKTGQLQRVRARSPATSRSPRSPTASRRARREQNQALLFESVEGFDMPVLINAFGSPERMAAALGVEQLNELSARVAKLLD